jgi:hypothetical protein
MKRHRRKHSSKRELDERRGMLTTESDVRRKRYYRRIHRITGKVPWWLRADYPTGYEKVKG